MLHLLKIPVKALLLDLDGVLWKDNTPLVNIPKIYARLADLSIIPMLVTNNGTRTPEQYVEKMGRFGVVVKRSQVITSAIGIAHLVHIKFPTGGPIFMIGEEGLKKALFDKGFHHDEKKPMAVVAGLDRKMTYETLKQATLLIRTGLPFFFTNPDKTFPTTEGLIPGAGAVLSFLEAATDVNAMIAGKPYPYLYQLALDRLNLPASQALAVGDRLDTDILGGQRAGCQTALVLSGVSTEAELDKWDPKPDLVAKDLTELLG